MGSPEFLEGKRYGMMPDLEQAVSRLQVFQIPASLVKQVNEAAMRANISPQLFYLLALRCYLGRVSQTDDVIVDTPIAGRSTKIQKQSGLTIVNVIPFRSVIPEVTAFSNALCSLDAIQKEMYRHVKVQLDDISLYLSEHFSVPLGCTYDSTWLTYQPYLNLDSTELRFHASKLCNGFIPVSLYLIIQPCDTSGDLSAIYESASGYTRAENVERFHSFMLRFLKNGLDVPETSLKDLIDKSL